MASVADLSSQLDELPDLMKFPTVVQELLQLVQGSKVSIVKICQLIECDPGLSLELLRIANSSMYGCGGQVRSVEQAAVLMGTRGIHDLAVATASASLFQKPNAVVKELWHHSLGCATVARILAEVTNDVDKNDAFTAGLLHDVGKLIFLQVLDGDYQLVDKSMSGEVVVEEEADCFGISHTEIGGVCSEAWGLPMEICDAIRNHHSPVDADFDLRLSELVCAANHLSKVWGIGVPAPVEQDELEILSENHCEIDEAALPELRDRAPAEFEASLSAFGGGS